MNYITLYNTFSLYTSRYNINSVLNFQLIYADVSLNLIKILKTFLTIHSSLIDSKSLLLLNCQLWFKVRWLFDIWYLVLKTLIIYKKEVFFLLKWIFRGFTKLIKTYIIWIFKQKHFTCAVIKMTKRDLFPDKINHPRRKLTTYHCKKILFLLWNTKLLYNPTLRCCIRRCVILNFNKT